MELDWKKRINEEVEVLKKTRDELRVQLHLGAAEAHDVWEKMERSWEHLESKLRQVGNAGKESASDVEEATRMLVDEIKSGYQRIRGVL